MKSSFGSNARFNIRKSGSHRLIVLDVKASRRAHAQWSAGIWKRIVKYVNGADSQKEDDTNVLWLMPELGWSPRALANWGNERQEQESRILIKAQEVRPQVAEILFWVAKPGENAERDGRAVEIISARYRGAALELVKGSTVSLSFETEYLLDSISRFVYDSLQQFSKDLARLPEPSPIRICATQPCFRFFVRDGKHLHCEIHRGVKAFRSKDENRRYKFIRDNLRTPARKLKKKLMSRRIEIARDGAWKLKCLIRIHNDLTKKIKKRPTDYLRTT